MEAAISKQLLNATEVQQKVRRIAFEIYEQNFTESEITIVGIAGIYGGEGWNLASRISSALKEIFGIQVHLIRVPVMNETSIPDWVNENDNAEKANNKVVIVVDDVLNTGRTLFYALTSFKDVSVKKLQVAVMVDRSYHHFPIRPDFIGYSLSTTINEHVRVVLSDPEKEGVFLL
jgi:pyrimidine operon attenuation protein/uracil phosphoribosyltransferase